MKRRKFLKSAAAAAAATVISPYILPSGRLFAASGTRLANHVVFVLFAGGIRNQEAVEQLYVSTQNGLPTSGNIMENMLVGARPTTNLVYNQWAPVLSTPLSAQGSLFQELRYTQGPTGHYNGHTVAVSGHYTDTGVNVGINPEFPTIFEYYRKHSNPDKSATKAWWISNSLGPYPSLNYSRHDEYGASYGANFLSPLTTFGNLADEYWANAKSYQPDDVARIENMKGYLNKSFNKSANALPGISHNFNDTAQVRQFVLDMIDKTNTGGIDWPVPAGSYPNGDLVNIGYTWEVMQEFEPELTVLNMTAPDACHTDFSSYLTNLHRADYGVGWLWDKIQSNPNLANDTIMICMPEHGRNLLPNTLGDANGLLGFDHTSDDNSRRNFALIAGPAGVVDQGTVHGNSTTPVGENIDIVPTIAHILGIHGDIPSGLLPGRVLTEAFI